MTTAKQSATPKQRSPARGEAERSVPPPPDELESEWPLSEPAENTADVGLAPEAELLTSYPDRSEWEADVSERAREEIHEAKHSKETKRPPTGARAKQ